MQSTENPVLIIGNGVAGITLAREIRKRGDMRPITIISGETKHHFSRTALMYIFMGHLNYNDTKPYPDDFWDNNNLSLLQDWVEKIDHSQKTITLRSGTTLPFQDLVIATGSAPNLFGWPGQDLPGVQSLYSKQDLDLLEENVTTTKHAIIVGGGLIGVEMAEMLLTRGISVTFLVREKAFWDIVLPQEEAELIGRHIREHHIDLRLETELDSIHAGPDGRVAKIITKDGEEIETQLVALTVGVHPNIDWLKDTPDLDFDRGVLIDHHFQTSLKNVWSIGDCAQFREPLPDRRPIEQVWYTGKMQATFLASNLCGKPRSYEPGIWWNSAKFFDIEYHTYGTLFPQTPSDQSSFYWESKNGIQSIRINYLTESLAVKAVNVFGIRHRHQVWEHWIKNEITITDVLSNLTAANFDPEFFKQNHSEIINSWNNQNPQKPQKPLQPKTKKGLFSNILRKINATST